MSKAPSLLNLEPKPQQTSESRCCRSPFEHAVTSFVVGVVSAVGIALALFHYTDLSNTWIALSGAGGGLLTIVVSYTAFRLILGKSTEKTTEKKSDASKAAQASAESQGLLLFDETRTLSKYAAVVAFENKEKRDQWISRASQWSCFTFKDPRETPEKCFVTVCTSTTSTDAERPAIQNVLSRLGLSFKLSPLSPLSIVYNDRDRMTLRFKSKEDGFAWLELVRAATQCQLKVSGCISTREIPDVFFRISGEVHKSVTQVFKEAGLDWEEANSTNTFYQAISIKHQQKQNNEETVKAAEGKVATSVDHTPAYTQSKGLLLLPLTSLISNYAVVVAFESAEKRDQWVTMAKAWYPFRVLDYRNSTDSRFYATLCTVKDPSSAEHPTILKVFKDLGLPWGTNDNYPQRIVENGDNSMTLHFKNYNDGLAWLNLFRPTCADRLHVCGRTDTTLTIKPHEFNEKITNILERAGLTWEKKQPATLAAEANPQPQRIVYNGYNPNTMTMHFKSEAEGLAWWERCQKRKKPIEISLVSSSGSSMTFEPISGMENITDLFNEAGLTWEEPTT